MRLIRFTFGSALVLTIMLPQAVQVLQKIDKPLVYRQLPMQMSIATPKLRITANQIKRMNTDGPALFDSSATAKVKESSTMERHTDRPGAYYRYQPLNRSLGFGYCQNLCDTDSRCKSYTFKTDRNGNKSCSLKENIYPKRSDPTATSGIKSKYLERNQN